MDSADLIVDKIMAKMK